MAGVPYPSSAEDDHRVDLADVAGLQTPDPAWFCRQLRTRDDGQVECCALPASHRGHSPHLPHPWTYDSADRWRQLWPIP